MFFRAPPRAALPPAARLRARAPRARPAPRSWCLTRAPLLPRRVAVTIAAGGVLPNIHSVLLPKASAAEGKAKK